MRFIKNMIKKFINYVMREDSQEKYATLARSKDNDVDLDLDHEKTFRFNIMPAHGGKIIELRSYDSKTDRIKQTLYIIHNSDDLSEEISQIITKEYISR